MIGVKRMTRNLDFFLRTMKKERRFLFERAIHTGSASPSSTEFYCNKYPLGCSPVKFPKKNWSIGRIGVGTFRLNQFNNPNRFAVSEAIQSGFNFIDTSGSYQNGNAERVLGDIFNELITEEKKIFREDLVISSKGGCIQGDELTSLLEERKIEEKRNTTLFKIKEDLYFSCSPPILENQITQSLKRMGLETLDVYFLSFPEFIYQYFDQMMKNGERGEREGETKRERMERVFMEQMLLAFTHLENEVRKGRIQSYGIVSNSFHVPPEHEEHISLSFLLKVAEEAARGFGFDEHHFCAIQTPFNILEGESAVIQSQTSPFVSKRQTVFDFAKENDLVVFPYRLFNAIQDGEDFVRLVETPNYENLDLVGLTKEGFDTAIHWEKDYPGLPRSPSSSSSSPSSPSPSPSPPSPSPSSPPPPGVENLPDPSSVLWAHNIAPHTKSLRPLWRWKDILARQIEPILYPSLIQVDKATNCIWWSSKYRPIIQRVFERYTWTLETANATKTAPIKQKLAKIDSTLGQTTLNDIDSPPFHLTTAAIRVGLVFDCCCCVVGVRSPVHVKVVREIVKESGGSGGWLGLGGARERVLEVLKSFLGSRK